MLIIVAGVSALLLMLSVAFLTRMRGDADESRDLMRTVQARLMLDAALQYIQESSRIGWDDPATPAHEEAFGWIDVRDGTIGPKDQFGNRLYACTDPVTGRGPAYPAVGNAARMPCYVMRRPPYATSMVAFPNPMANDPTQSWAKLVDRRHFDPQPVIDPSWTIPYASFAAGDRRPRQASVGLSWFRTYRCAPATFVVTCGAGATQGFKDWAEVVAAGRQATFLGPEAFADMRAAEVILWYEVEWSPSVGHSVMNIYNSTDTYTLSRVSGNEEAPAESSKPYPRQFGGTFAYIQRLVSMPPIW